MKDALGSVQSVLVLGAGSDIAQATVRRLVADRARSFVLAGRDASARLGPFADELRVAGAKTVELVEFDADAVKSHGAVLESAIRALEDLDLVLVAFGVLGDADVTRADAAAAVALFRTNVIGTVSVLMETVGRLRAQGHGTIAVLSSVVAERVRRSNFPYGASKAAIDGFCQGLGDHLAGSGVRVMIVRPGFVRSKMTTDLEPAPLATTPAAVADAIVAGLRRGADIVWVPPALRWVMVLARHLPRAMFRRLDL